MTSDSSIYDIFDYIGIRKIGVWLIH